MIGAVLLLLTLSPAARAGDDGVTLSLAGGYVWTDPNENLESTWTAVGRLGYTLNRRWTLEADTGYLQGYTRAWGHGYDALTPRLNVLLNLTTEGPVQPYIALGGGTIWKKVRRDANVYATQAKEGEDWGNYKNPDSDFQIDAGPGTHVRLAGPISLRVDLRAMVNLGSEPHGDIPDDFINWELTAGFCFRDAERRRDTDKDGIVDRVDDCVEQPEDRDDFEDEDGCPDNDNDGDEIEDADDDCRDEPEDRDHFEDKDGCPEEDNDKDGILDEEDRCRTEAEDKDGHEDRDGCPDDDNDGDGIADLEDGCPNRAEDIDQWRDDDGCPDEDNDGDRVADRVDACPNVPEVYNKVDDEDGCPDDIPPPPKELEKFTGVIHGINFKVNSDEITVDSYRVLDEAAAVFVKFKDARVEIQGHTDSDGQDARNLELSARRARSVVTYLVRRGVDPDQLEWVGYGETRPLVPNTTQSAKAVNRRVEFHLLDAQAPP